MIIKKFIIFLITIHPRNKLRLKLIIVYIIVIFEIIGNKEFFRCENTIVLLFLTVLLI